MVAGGDTGSSGRVTSASDWLEECRWACKLAVLASHARTRVAFSLGRAHGPRPPLVVCRCRQVAPVNNALHHISLALAAKAKIFTKAEHAV